MWLFSLQLLFYSGYLPNTTVLTFQLPDPGGRRGPEAPHGCLSCLGGEVWPCTRQWRPQKGPAHSGMNKTNRLYQRSTWCDKFIPFALPTQTPCAELWTILALD